MKKKTGIFNNLTVKNCNFSQIFYKDKFLLVLKVLLIKNTFKNLKLFFLLIFTMLSFLNLYFIFKQKTDPKTCNFNILEKTLKIWKQIFQTFLATLTFGILMIFKIVNI